MVPSEKSSKEDEGFLFILLWNGERRGIDVVILDAKDLKGLAVYELPISMPHGLLGSWVNQILEKISIKSGIIFFNALPL